LQPAFCCAYLKKDEWVQKMKTIISHVPAKTTTSYQCAKCKTKYRSKARALQCELLITEEKAFKVGDRVRWCEELHCSAVNKNYWMDGKVQKILGPALPDFEYNAKWLGGKLFDKHIFMYEVSWKCPHCKLSCSGRYYSLELGKIKSGSRK